MPIPKKNITIGGEVFEVPDLGALFGRGLNALFIVIGALWLLSGIYIVQAEQQGVVRRFGKFVRVTSPGINYRLPWPIERVDKVGVATVRRAEVGFRTIDPGPPAKYQDKPEESLMLTGNLNIVKVDLIIQYKIVDPVDFLFKVKGMEATRRPIEAALRQVVGKHEIDEILTTGKGEIQEETLMLLQKIVDSYEAGLKIVAVQLQDVHPPDAVRDAFKDVASAREDRDRLVNIAQGYAADIIPRARGEAAKMVKDAEAFASERVAKAEGDAENFNRILNEYRSAREVTRKRMLLETLEQVLPGLKKYIVKSDKSGGILNILPLGSAAEGGRK
ncbi:MAG: FtsH protease activity modulator HflK [Calditrichaeota bacterium]|nr:FtsH protease activity modulator HflK [Calditrichota bacterium]